MFHWLADRRRKKLIQAPFPTLWEDIIRRNVAHYCMLEDDERAHLRALIHPSAVPAASNSSRNPRYIGLRE